MNIAIIGCGSVCEKYILGLQAINGVRIEGFFDKDPARAQEKAGTTNTTAFENIEAILANPTIDLIVNLTPPEEHYDLNKRILYAGKNVFSEKPISLTALQAYELQEIAEKRNLYMMAAPDTFLAEPFQMAQKIHNEGRIGLATSFSAVMVGPGHEAWHPQPDYYYKKGSGPLWDMGPYFISQLVHMLGPVATVSAMGSTPRKIRTYRTASGENKSIDVEVPTHYDVIIQTESGISGTFTASYDVLADCRPYFDIYGTEGVLRLENPDEYRGKISIIKNNIAEEILCPEIVMPPRARAFGILDLYNSYAQGCKPKTAGKNTAHVIHILESIETSLAQKRQVLLFQERACQ